MTIPSDTSDTISSQSALRVAREIVGGSSGEGLLLLSRNGADWIITASNSTAKSFLDTHGESEFVTAALRCPLYQSEHVKCGLGRAPTYREEFLDQLFEEFTVSVSEVPECPDLKLVNIARYPDYNTLKGELQQISFMVETSTRGSGLFELDPATGKTTFLFASRRHASLVGSTKQELRELGLPAFGRYVPSSDREESMKLVVDAAARLGTYNAILRVFINNEYKWVRCSGSCSPGVNGMIEVSTSTEDYTEGAELVAQGKMGRSAKDMLSTFIAAIFDVSFYLDEKFRFVEDSAKVRYIFSVPGGQTIKGRPLEIFLRLDDDKHKFREYMCRPLERLPSSATHLAAAPMIRLKMCLDNLTLTDVQVYASPTWFEIDNTDNHQQQQNTGRAETPFSDESTSSSSDAQVGPARYLVGLNVVASRNGGQPATPPPESTASSVHSVPVGRKSSGHRPSLPDLAEHGRTRGMSAESATYPTGYFDAPPSLGEVQPVGRSIAKVLTRVLTRDLVLTVSNTVHEEGRSWLIPMYICADRIALQEEVARSLPNHLQADFLRTLHSRDMAACSQLLSFSLEGNLDLLSSHSAATMPIKRSYLVGSVLRLFIASALTADADVAITVMHGLCQWAFRTQTKSPSSVNVLVNTHLILGLASVAVRHPAHFQSGASVDWLRSTFASCLAGHEQLTHDKNDSLPLLYWVCVLWASMKNVIGRTAQATSLLATAMEDMAIYRTRHPQSISVGLLSAIAAHNLAMGTIAKEDPVGTLNWIHEIQDIVTVTGLDVGERCRALVEWAEDAQQRAQSDKDVSDSENAGSAAPSGTFISSKDENDNDDVES